jgi:hypothetical protein
MNNKRKMKKKKEFQAGTLEAKDKNHLFKGESQRTDVPYR